MKFEKPLIIEHKYLGYSRLVLEENALRYTFGKEETVVPISSIKSFKIKDARSLSRPGTITIDAGSPNSGYMGVGRFAFSLGSEIIMVFNKEDSKTAYDMRDYIANYGQRDNAVSAADEIRKLKALCDDGIITASEFDEKKKSLLK